MARKTKLDKAIENAYIWYSGATGITGANFVEELKTKGGKTAPNNDVKIIIGWGTKTKKDITFEKDVKVLNHPNAIRLNRNKLKALGKMTEANVSVKPFVTADEVQAALADDNSPICFPLIGRTKFHQGGKGFWMCPTMTHILAAIEDGAQYFQNMIEIVDEYRLHVVCGKVVHAVRKTKRTIEDMEKAFVEDEFNRQLDIANKKGIDFNAEVVQSVLTSYAKKFAAAGPNMFIRSNKLGWKFKSANKTVPNNLKEQAVAAVAAIGLDFGAVDCCTDSNGNPFIIEVNSGPGLEGKVFELWCEQIKETIKALIAPPKKTKKKLTKSEKLAAIEQLIEEIDDETEITALRKVANRLN